MRSKSSWRQVMLVFAVANLFAPAAGAVDPDNPAQWQVENTEAVLGNEPYELHNLRRRALNLSSQLGFVRKKNHLLERDQDDLGWPGHSGGHFVFVRHDKTDRSSILESEVVAIYNTLNRKYLTEAFEILPSLTHKFSSSPSFEWMLHGRRGASFALYNIKRGGYLMLGGKHHGVDASLTFANCSGGENRKTDPHAACNKNWQATSGEASTPPTPTAQPPAGGAIIRTGAGLCLDVHAPEYSTNGGRVQAWSCNGQSQQLWRYDRGTRTLRVSSGLCLDTHTPEMTTNGGRVQVWACHGQVNQQWTPAADGTLRNGGGLCLDVHALDQRKNGARVQVWTCHGAQQQHFTSAAFQ